MSFQSFLTITVELLVLGSIALYGSLFLDGLMKRHRPIPGQLEIDFSAIQPQEPELTAPVFTLEHRILPFKRRTQQLQEIDLSGMTIRQLKAVASCTKLPRYNTCTKAELQARLLAEVERDRLLAALAA